MLQASLGKDKQLQVDLRKDGITVDGTPFEWDLAEVKPGRYHIIRNGRSFQAEVVHTDPAEKTFALKINGQLHTVQLKDETDLLLEKLGMNTAGSSKVQELKAPMPGLIIDIKVTEGQEVQKGTPILILEAMKMENILKSPADGIIRSIKVNLRQNVEKGQVLIQF